MKRYLPWILFLLFGVYSAWGSELAVPNKLTIRLGGVAIEGWLELPEDVDADKVFKWKPEGFVYRLKTSPADEFQVTAWSSKGRAGKILSLAEDKLLEAIQNASPHDRKPVGYVTSGRKERNPVKKTRSYPDKLTVAKSEPKVKDAPKAVPPSEEIFRAQIEATRPIAQPSRVWRWLLLLLAILLWPLRWLLQRMKRNKSD